MYEIHDLLLGYAHQHDRLVMLDQLGPGDMGVTVETDDDVDGLTGIAGRVDHVRVEEGVADRLSRLEQGNDRWIALRRTECVGPRRDLAGLRPRQEVAEP